MHALRSRPKVNLPPPPNICPLMAADPIVVAKYGGSSLATPEDIHGVARRLAAGRTRAGGERRRGLGDGRHDRRSPGARPAREPAARSARARPAAGHRRAGQRGTAGDGASRPGLPSRQPQRSAGGHQHRRRLRTRANHRRRPGSNPAGARQGPHRCRRRLPGRHRWRGGNPRPRRIGYKRRGAGHRAGRDTLRDLHRRRRCLHCRPSAGARRAPPAEHRLRGDARAGPPGCLRAPDALGRAGLGSPARARRAPLERRRRRNDDHGGQPWSTRWRHARRSAASRRTITWRR